MAEYTQGQNEDVVIKTTETDKTLDLTVFIRKFVQLRNALQALPARKTVPDIDSMRHWNESVYVEGQEQKINIDVEVVELYNEITAIKDAGFLPSKYDDDYQQLETYVNNL